MDIQSVDTEIAMLRSNPVKLQELVLLTISPTNVRARNRLVNCISSPDGSILCVKLMQMVVFGAIEARLRALEVLREHLSWRYLTLESKREIRTLLIHGVSVEEDAERLTIFESLISSVAIHCRWDIHLRIWDELLEFLTESVNGDSPRLKLSALRIISLAAPSFLGVEHTNFLRAFRDTFVYLTNSPIYLIRYLALDAIVSILRELSPRHMVIFSGLSEPIAILLRSVVASSERPPQFDVRTMPNLVSINSIFFTRDGVDVARMVTSLMDIVQVNTVTHNTPSCLIDTCYNALELASIIMGSQRPGGVYARGVYLGWLFRGVLRMISQIDTPNERFDYFNEKVHGIGIVFLRIMVKRISPVTILEHSNNNLDNLGVRSDWNRMVATMIALIELSNKPTLEFVQLHSALVINLATDYVRHDHPHVKWAAANLIRLFGISLTDGGDLYSHWLNFHRPHVHAALTDVINNEQSQPLRQRLQEAHDTF